MRGAVYAEMQCFIEVARHASFAKAAKSLDLVPSTLSAAIAGLEERLGVRLFNRTTRSVSLTEAGESLLARVRPAMDELATAVEVVNEFRNKPAGRLRLSVSSIPAQMIVAPLLSRFLAAYPAIELDITVNDKTDDIVKGQFDAGIRYGRWIAQDMTVIKVFPHSRIVAIASPSYLEQHPAPVTPQDLHKHNCIRYRRSEDDILRWRFKKGRKETEIAVGGSLVVNNIDMAVQAAIDGVGIGYMVEAYIKQHLKSGALVTLLDNWAPSWDGYYLYYASRRQMPVPLRAFIDFLGEQLGREKIVKPIERNAKS